MTRKRKAVGITLRIMWDDVKQESKAREFLSVLEKALREAGIRYTKSKTYRNRKNTGGRIYIKLRV